MGSRLEQKSNLIRKRIEQHSFADEKGEEYEGSRFGGFPEYFRRKKIKLQNLDVELRAHSGDLPQIFRGTVCHVNGISARCDFYRLWFSDESVIGYTQPSLNDLHVMIVRHGGGFIQYLDGKTMVTHIIASNLTPKKREEFKRYRIVKPAWIVDSINAGKVLPWDAYRVIDEGVGQRLLGFEAGQIISQVNNNTSTYRDQTDSSWYTEQLRSKGKLPLSSDLNERSLGDDFAETDAADVQDRSPIQNVPDVTSSIERMFDNDIDDRSVGSHCQPSRSLNDGQRMDDPAGDERVIAADNGPTSVSPMLKDYGNDTVGGVSELKSRQGSQEPDYSMAIVRESDVLRNISAEQLAKMSAEEHNSLLLSDPRIRKSTVVNPDFLEQYYRESRLHHLSAWKADLKAQLQALALATSTWPNKTRKSPLGQRRYILHIDFDCFFAAVSLRKRPDLKDKPAVVAHGNGSGSEIASCNYPARAFGISNGMWMKRAQQLCSDLHILPYDFPAYEEASRHFYDTILAIGGVVQSVSIDEALVDISAACIEAGGLDGLKRDEGAVHREQSRADEIASELRKTVFNKTACNVSVGIGGNILQAKIALRKAKPAGQYHLKPEDVLDIIGILEVQKLPGVAWSIGGKLEEIGIKLVKDILATSREKLAQVIGPKTGERLWEYARGIDRTEVGNQVVRKSVSAEVNWGVRFENQEQVDEFMYGLCGELHKRLVKERVKGKQLTMKVMRRADDAPRDPPKHLGHGKCDTFNKSLQLGVPTNDASRIAKEAIILLKSFNITPGELRGIGVQMQKLTPIRVDREANEESSQPRLRFKLASGISEMPHDVGKEERLARQISDVSGLNREEGVPKDAGNNSSTPPPPNEDHESPSLLTTQFVMPTQVDSTVLAELPEGIRSRLIHNARPDAQLDMSTLVKAQAPGSSITSSRSNSPAICLPTESQLDPEILNALPEDVRSEIFEHYSHKAQVGGQALLPQSPRKNRIIPPLKAMNRTVNKRRRGTPTLLSRPRHERAHGITTLTQSNFVSNSVRQNFDNNHAKTDSEPETEELDPDVLAALPHDLRLEVLDQQRQARLQKTGGIDLSMHRRSKASGKKMDDENQVCRTLRLSSLPEQPGFTSRKLTGLSDLRIAIKAWHLEFSEEGPYDDDVKALREYLAAVVLLEKDLDKATAVVRWLDRIVREATMANNGVYARDGWLGALNTIKIGLQGAATQRGLGRIRID